MLRRGSRQAAPSRGEGALSPQTRIVCLHRVIREADLPRAWPYRLRGTALSESELRRHLDHLAREYTFIDEDTAWARLRGEAPKVERACWLTFDDGYRDNHTVAAPILAEYGIRPTLFLTTGVLDRGWLLPVDRWYGALISARRRQGVLRGFGEAWAFDLDEPGDRARFVCGPEKRRFLRGTPDEQDRLLAILRESLESAQGARPPAYLDASDLRALSDLGWSIAPHGHSHAILTDLSEGALRGELLTCCHTLASLGIRPSRAFAYADAAVDEATRSAVRCILEPRGCLGALTLDPRDAQPGDSPWLLPRRLLLPQEHPGDEIF